MPQPRRTCIVTLIPKLRGVRNVSQYRPLALTDIMAKISCNVLRTRLRIRLPYAMPPWSLGCRAGSSCTHVLFLYQQLIEKTGEWDISLLLVGHLTVFFGNPCMSASLSWLVKTWQRPTSLYGPLGAVYLGEVSQMARRWSSSVELLRVTCLPLPFSISSWSLYFYLCCTLGF